MENTKDPCPICSFSERDSVYTSIFSEHFKLQATKLFIVTSATKGEPGWLPPPLDLVLGSRYYIV